MNITIEKEVLFKTFYCCILLLYVCKCRIIIKLKILLFYVLRTIYLEYSSKYNILKSVDNIQRRNICYLNYFISINIFSLRITNKCYLKFSLFT